MFKDPISTEQAAAILNVTTRHVRWLIEKGDLKAEKFGRDYMLSRKDVESYTPRAKGRPPKERGNK